MGRFHSAVEQRAVVFVRPYRHNRERVGKGVYRPAQGKPHAHRVVHRTVERGAGGNQ